MTAGASPSSDPFFTGVGEAEASRLLQLAIRGRRRPVDDLIERLRRADGAAWFEETLRGEPFAGFGDARELLVQGRASAETLIALKDRSKSGSAGSGAGGDRLAGIAAYFLAVAAALTHHGRLICSRTRRDLDPVLLDLAEAAPTDWSDLLSRAAMAPDSNAA